MEESEPVTLHDIAHTLARDPNSCSPDVSHDHFMTYIENNLIRRPFYGKEKFKDIDWGVLDLGSQRKKTIVRE